MGHALHDWHPVGIKLLTPGVGEENMEVSSVLEGRGVP